MQKHQPHIIVLFIFSLLFFGCKEEKEEIDPYPNVSFFPTNSTTAFEGDTVRFNFNVTAPEKLKVAYSYKSVNGGGETSLDTFDLSSNQASIQYEYVVEEITAGSTIELRFEAIDILGAKNDVTFTINVLGLQNLTGLHFDYPSDSSALSFFSAANAGVFDYDSSETMQLTTDWMYNYDSSSTTYAGVYAMNDTMPDFKFLAINFWVFRNATLFKPSGLTTVQFDALTASDVSLVVGDASPANLTFIDSLAINDVVAFKTVGDRHGVLKVTALQPGLGMSDFMEMDIWIQEEQ